ncbi:hypothetical protein QBC47DRAFT_431817 [Echria macrotheca]|uniref:F-box domain-containing protein n=1 Tax=Echria macrotheca TaxID=438768 RepID=A0AAJ0BAU4_9PEZI|nr:hypothetical protein QBC47DRAFT_431817 [Echria macrotheca]
MALILERFPNEILTLIFGYFCEHCSDPLCEWQRPRSASFSGGQPTLARLSLTCRAFRQIAQPILFHHFPQTAESSSNFRQLQLFVRSLTDRPDLSTHVRILGINLVGEERETQGQFVMRMALRNVPNVQLLDVNQNASFPLDHIFLGLDHIFPSNLEFASLRCLRLARAPGGHIGGRMEELSRVMMTSSRLESLELARCASWGLPNSALASLRRLDLFEPCFSAAEAEQLLAACSRLMMFSLCHPKTPRGDDGGPLTPAGIVEALRHMSGTMKTLMLSIAPFADGSAANIEALADFPVLEDLVVGSAFVQGQRRAMSLIRSLPRSLKCLVVVCRATNGTAWLQNLLDRVQETEQLPSLRVVRLLRSPYLQQWEEEQLREWQLDFRGAGVDFHWIIATHDVGPVLAGVLQRFFPH